MSRGPGVGRRVRALGAFSAGPGYGQVSSNFTAPNVTGCPLSFTPAAGVWVQTFQFDSTRMKRCPRMHR